MSRWKVGDTLIDGLWPTGVTEIVDGSGYVVALVPEHIGSARNGERRLWAQMICDEHNAAADKAVKNG